MVSTSSPSSSQNDTNIFIKNNLKNNLKNKKRFPKFVNILPKNEIKNTENEINKENEEIKNQIENGKYVMEIFKENSNSEQTLSPKIENMEMEKIIINQIDNIENQKDEFKEYMRKELMELIKEDVNLLPYAIMFDENQTLF